MPGSEDLSAVDAIAKRVLGKTGVEVSQLGFGGVALGGRFRRISEEDALNAIRVAFEAGVNYFDTAPWYGHGLSEHRLGHYLHQKRRQAFVLSTKVGRVYSRPRGDPTWFDTSPWVGGLPFAYDFDYTFDGVIRSYEDSLQRMGLNRIDLIVIHDLDLLTHHSEESVTHYFGELDHGGGWKALAELRSSGEIRGIGVGVNQEGTMAAFLDRFDVDFFLVAMPYTLLDQGDIVEGFARCFERNIGVIVGAPYASGILASGPQEGARYNYEPAPPGILDRVARIESVCRRYQVPLRSVALQFPLGHPIVASVIPGVSSPRQVLDNLRMMSVDIPLDVWSALKGEGLLPAEAPTPSEGPDARSAITRTLGSSCEDRSGRELKEREEER